MRPLVPSTKSRDSTFSGFSEGVRNSLKKRYCAIIRHPNPLGVHGGIFALCEAVAFAPDFSEIALRGMGFTPSQNSDWKERAVRGCGRLCEGQLGQTMDTEGA